MSTASEVDAVIVGAGVAGLYQLHKLRNLGLRTRVIEAGDGIGGTWFWNKYPGARCDIESTFYSYSFSSELEQEWTWTEKFTTGQEILRYVNHVADRFDLRKDITLGTRVTAAVYDESAKRWHVHTDQEETIATQFLVMATGVLSVPKMPELPGIETFRGRSHHTAHWPDAGVDFTGQRVGVIGTGSSGVQSIPIIAQQATELSVFQRTPAFCLPAGNRLLTNDEITHTKANYPQLRDAERNSAAGVPTTPPTQSALATTPQDRRAKYECAWQDGNFIHIIYSYNDIMLNEQANETACEFVREKIRSLVRRARPCSRTWRRRSSSTSTGFRIALASFGGSEWRRSTLRRRRRRRGWSTRAFWQPRRCTCARSRGTPAAMCPTSRAFCWATLVGSQTTPPSATMSPRIATKASS